MSIGQVSEQAFHLSQYYPDAPSSLAALVTNEGVPLVDTGSSEMADDLREAVASWGFEKPIYIISTHEHTDHIGCNEASSLQQSWLLSSSSLPLGSSS